MGAGTILVEQIAGIEPASSDWKSEGLPLTDICMATTKGLEPSTSGVTGRRSHQLNYVAIYGGCKTSAGEDTSDLELSRRSLKTAIAFLIWSADKELSSPIRRSRRACAFGGPCRARTYDTLINSQVLYLLS